MTKDSIIVPYFILKGLATINADCATIGRVFAIVANHRWHLTGYERGESDDTLDVARVVADMLEEYNSDLDDDPEEV